MKKTLLLVAAASVLLGGLGFWTAAADPPKESKALKPVVVFSHASYNKMLENVAMFGKVSGNPELARELNVILKLLAIQQGLTPPDKARPWGAVMLADGDTLTGCAFVPTADLAKLAALMEPLVGKAEGVGGGIYKIRSRTKTVYLKQKDGWAFFALSVDALDVTPADPVGLLADLNSQYDAAVRVYPANLLPKHREQWIAWLKKNLEPYGQQGRHEPDRVYELRKQLADEMVQPIMAAVNDLDTVTVGWTIDTAAPKTSVEFSVTVKDGTETARRLASVYDIRSQFSGFRLPGAALVGNWAVQLPSLKTEKLNALVEAYRVLAVDDIEKKEQTPAKAQLAKRLVADLTELVLGNIHSGRIDGGMAVLLKPDAVTLLAGGYVADGVKLTEAVKAIVAVAVSRDSRAAEWIKLDAEEFRSVRFHTLSIPIPPDARDRERIVSLVGETIGVVIGIGPQSAYVAAGREPLAALKQVIELSAANAQKDLPQVEISLALGDTARFVAAAGRIEKVRSLATLLAAALEPAANRDHVKLVATSIPNGVKYRMEVEEGILELLGRLAALITGEEPPK